MRIACDEAVGTSDWAETIAKVRRGEPLMGPAAETLMRGLRTVLSRRVNPAHCGSVTQRVLAEVTSAVRGGQARNAEEIARSARSAMCAILTAEPELGATEAVSAAIARPHVSTAVAAMPADEREMLRRYYAEGETPERICASMRVGRDEFDSARDRLRARAVA